MAKFMRSEANAVWNKILSPENLDLSDDLEIGIADTGEGGGLSEDGFCHIVDESGLRTHCGKRVDESVTCRPYAGEAICPSCGLPNCPTCTVRTDLNNRLEGL
jgi:hypothetical protein